MELINNTPLPALVFEKSGRFSKFYYVVIARATYDLHHDRRATLADKQENYIVADEYFSEPFDQSALKRETDLLLYKPRCDIYFHGHAYAPNGSAPSWHVQVQYQQKQKNFRVTGPKNWFYSEGRWRLSEPEAVDAVRLDYRLAFGGNPDPENGTLSPYASNTAGIGYYKKSLLDPDKIYPAPQFENADTAYTHMKDSYPVEGLSPLCRWWPARTQYLGTYDEQWQRETHPFHPDDFDERFYNAAPPELVVPYPSGGESLYTRGLFQSGDMTIVLPPHTMDLVIDTPSEKINTSMPLDTIAVNTDSCSMALTWRAIVPREKLPEVATLDFHDKAHEGGVSNG